MPIRITSKKDGFWRCGVRHSSTPTVYPDDRFTPEQLKRLQAEPMLIVDVIEDEKPKPKASKKAGKDADNGDDQKEGADGTTAQSEGE